ncbi:MAG: hypothetical protein Q8M03_09110 [Legionella sp.]|nr:hypothetical protein [Legionella sp.]
MKLVRNLLACCFVFFIPIGYSNHSEHLSPLFKTFKSAYLLPATKNPQASKIIADILNKHDYLEETSQSMLTLMDNVQQYHQEIIHELQTKVSHFQTTAADEKMHINLLDLRLSDAVMMLEAQKTSPRLTLEIVQKMREIAIDAASGNHSADELKNMDVEFQTYMSAIPYAQSIRVFDGVKKIAGGDLSIIFGNNNTPNATVYISVPSIDLPSLGLSGIDVLTNSDALAAISELDLAISTLQVCIVATSTPHITDAQVMLINIPYMLHQNFDFVLAARELILKAMNESLSPQDRALMDIEFDYFKQAMQKTQTYVSLSGPIMTGKGKVTIQMGSQKIPESTLEINIPTTDIYLLGISELQIGSLYDTNEAFTVILNIIKNFVYY